MLPAGAPLSDWLTWLETLSPTEIDLGLERVAEMLDRLQLAHPQHVLLIAGTNGKGSSVAMTDALLRATGMRVGTYTSPHIIDYNERIIIDGRPASDADIVGAFEAVEAVRNELPLTYFEYGTLAALYLFAEAGLDAWVLEVGLGGRLDATNAVEPTAALITNIALDHCEWLGDNIEKIAAEKAGVMRPGIPVVFGGEQVPRAIEARADELGARLLLRNRDFSLDGVPRPGLLGDFQIGNAAAVLALLEAAGIEAAVDSDLVQQVLPEVRLTGRGQRIERDGVEYLLDVAHNPAAAEALAQILASSGHIAATTAIIGLLDDKDAEGVARALDGAVDRWISVTADSHRALSAAELGRRIANACNRPCEISKSLEDAIDSARRDVQINDRILVTGSFYLVGPALERLGADSGLYSRPQS